MTALAPTSPDERELIRSLHEGSVTALAEIYERTAPVLYALALRIVGSRERASCVLEDLYEEIWRDRASWRPATAPTGAARASGAPGAPGAAMSGPAAPLSGEIPLVAWIARCRELALAQVGPEHRREAMAPVESARPEPPLPVVTDTPGACGAAWPALAALPERDRFALEEAYFRGTPPREIAARIGASTTDAGMILRNALTRFRDHADQGVDEGEAAEANAGIAS